jgi:hypothetical protein
VLGRRTISHAAQRLSRAKRSALAAVWWAAGRRVILNSIPKCGTHLLQSLLLAIGVPFYTNELYVNDERAPALLDDMLMHGRGRAILGHLVVSDSYRTIAARRQARILFITRDPRDQVVSHVFHYRTHTDHPLHPYFRDRVPDLDAALMAGIRGFGPGPEGHLADVDTFYRYFLGWKDVPGVYSTTFERLIGAEGGGSAQQQLQEVHNILRHVGAPLRGGRVARLVARRVFSRQSPTFRAGRIGGWRQYFNDDHVRAFKEVAGQLLIELGYERDTAW